jgi:pimeloyl-ACP methyl ester carboxylesterase
MPDLGASAVPGLPGVERRVRLSHGLELSYLVGGSGPPVFLLHGFPDSALLWRHQIPALLDAGYQVVVPDLRGFGESSRPQEVEAYRLNKLLSDVVGLMQALGIRRAHFVAHDWGAVLGWMIAALMPHRVDHLVALSVGHPSFFRRPTLEQREKSWYMLLYQFECAEELLRRNGFRFFRELMADAKDVERYVADLSRPGALRAALNWYRANRSPEEELQPLRPLPAVQCPTLGIWGSGDRAMTEEGMRESRNLVSAPWRYERYEDAGHWIPLDAPDRLTASLLGFLGAHDSAPGQRRKTRRYRADVA